MKHFKNDADGPKKPFPATESEPKINFPDNLTPTDIELVVKQCENQKATSRKQIEGFVNAYLIAKQLALDEQKLKSLNSEQIKNLILELAALIEPRNKKGYRQIPITFKDGAIALESDKIPRAVESFCRGFVAFLEDPTEDERLNAALLYTEFEKIHPFEDGNGRVGDLLWKILETGKTGKWPETLPPDVFKKI